MTNPISQLKTSARCASGRRPDRRPHLRVLQQIGIDEHAQLGGMTKRGHATVDLGNPYANSTHKYTAQNVSTS